MPLRPRPAADRVEVVPIDSTEVRAAMDATGPTYDSWMNYWTTLDRSERDALTHPTWVAGLLRGQFNGATPGATDVIFTMGGNEVLSLLPVSMSRNDGALQHARGFESHSWPLARNDQDAALRSLFSTRLRGCRVRSLLLNRIEDGNALLTPPSPHVATPITFRSLIEFPAGYDELLSRLTPNARKGVRRLLRRMSRDHEVRVEAVVAADRIDAAFDRFLAVDDRSWKRRDGSILRHDVRQREALLGAMRLAAREGRAVCHFLRANDADIAAQLCVLIDGQLQLVKTSYDEGWANFGAGKLLLAETIRKWCPANGIHALNLVTGLQWHLQWQPRCIQTHGLWLLAPGMRGRVAGIRDVPARVNAKRLLARVGLEDQARRLLRRRKANV